MAAPWSCYGTTEPWWRRAAVGSPARSHMAETSTGRPGAGSPARIQPLGRDVDGLLSHTVAIADSASALRCHPPPPMRSGISSSWTGSTFSGSTQVLEVPSLEGMRWASTRDGATSTSPSGGSGSNFGGSGLPIEKRPCPQERKGGVQTSLPARGPRISL